MRLDKVIGLGLVGGCSVLALGTGLLLSGLGTNVDAVSDEDLSGGSAISERPIAVWDTPESVAYQEIKDRPLFNDSRRPIEIEVEDTGEDGEKDDENPPPADLDVAINGIIITPAVKVALVTDKRSNKRMRLKEGTPMIGEMAAWTLASIEPRKVVFENETGSSEELELVVNKKPLKGGPPPPRRQRQQQQQPQANQNNALQSDPGNDDAEVSDDEAERQRRAEEIRKRVAERRAQLRAEAARRREQQNELQEDDS